MSQKSDIRRHLESGKGLTRLQAVKLFGCVELPARIVELKAEGMKIIALPIRVNTRYGKKRVARYVKVA